MPSASYKSSLNNRLKRQVSWVLGQEGNRALGKAAQETQCKYVESNEHGKITLFVHRIAASEQPVVKKLRITANSFLKTFPQFSKGKSKLSIKKQWERNTIKHNVRCFFVSWLLFHLWSSSPPSQKEDCRIEKGSLKASEDSQGC